MVGDAARGAAAALGRGEECMNFCWVTINVKDMAESLRFYTEVLGLKLNRRQRGGPRTELAFLGLGGTEVELIRNEDRNDFTYGKDISIGFAVDSVDEMVKSLRAKGVEAIAGPFQPSPIVKFIYIDDPNGVKIQLVENLKP